MAKELRVGWIADIFDEVSGIITDTEEMFEQAKANDVYWQPITCYHKQIHPFHVFFPLVKVPTNSFYAGTSMYVPNVVNILAYLIRNRVNVIVSNTPGFMGMVAMACAAYLRLPWVDIYHTDIDYYAESLSGGFLLGNPLVKPIFNRAGLFYMKQYQKQADLIFVRTQEFHDLLLKKGHDKSKLRSYPAGVNIDHWNPSYSTPSIWKQMEIGEQNKVVLFVGRITKVKDIVFLLDFFEQEKPVGYELVLIGGGPEKDDYQKRYDKNPNIHFAGIKRGEELQQAYASADLYVLPSGSETLGKTILEAMASGTPALVSDKGGPRDYVKDKKNGRIFEAGNYESFKKVLGEMLADSTALDKMGNEARNSILGHTDKKLFQQFTGHLKELL